MPCVRFTILASLLSDFDVRLIWPKFFDLYFLPSCPQTVFGDERLLTLAGG